VDARQKSKKIPKKIWQHAHYNYSKSNISVTSNARVFIFFFYLKILTQGAFSDLEVLHFCFWNQTTELYIYDKNMGGILTSVPS